MQNISVKASKSDAIRKKVRHTKLNLDAVKQGKPKIESSDHDNVIETSKDDNENNLEAPETGTIDSKVTDTQTDNWLKENDQTTLETWIGPENWSRTNEHNRFQPAGNDASANQNGYTLGDTGPLEYNDDVRSEEKEMYKGADFNEDIFLRLG